MRVLLTIVSTSVRDTSLFSGGADFHTINVVSATYVSLIGPLTAALIGAWGRYKLHMLRQEEHDFTQSN